MNVLALDQSSKITGYAVFVDGALNHSGVINLTSSDLGIRLMQLREEIKDFITNWDIDYVIYEDIQLQQGLKDNVKTFKVLAEVIGNLEELFAELEMPHEAVLATVWKSALNIKGKQRAEQKKNAQAYVKKNYSLDVSEDESDAICIGTYFSVKDNSFDWTD